MFKFTRALSDSFRLLIPRLFHQLFGEGVDSLAFITLNLNFILPADLRDFRLDPQFELGDEVLDLVLAVVVLVISWVLLGFLT